MRIAFVAALALGMAASARAQIVRPASQGNAAVDSTILPPQEIGTIVIGRDRLGQLEAGDYTMSDGTWADVWYFNATAGQRIVIECRAHGFSAYLQLLNPWGDKLQEDAGGGSAGAARIVYTVREAGRYQIVVNNYSESLQAGTYLLSLR